MLNYSLCSLASPNAHNMLFFESFLKPKQQADGCLHTFVELRESTCNISHITSKVLTMSNDLKTLQVSKAYHHGTK